MLIIKFMRKKKNERHTTYGLWMPIELKRRYRELVFYNHVSVSYFSKRMRYEFLKLVNEIEAKNAMQITKMDLSFLDDTQIEVQANEGGTKDNPYLKETLTEDEEEVGNEDQVAKTTGDTDGSTTE